MSHVSKSQKATVLREALRTWASQADKGARRVIARKPLKGGDTQLEDVAISCAQELREQGLIMLPPEEIRDGLKVYLAVRV